MLILHQSCVELNLILIFAVCSGQKQEQGIVIPKKAKAVVPEAKSPPPKIREDEVPVKPLTTTAPSAPAPLLASSEATLEEEMALLQSLSQKNPSG